MDSAVTKNDMAKKIAIGYEKPFIELLVDNRKSEIEEYIREGAKIEGQDIEGEATKGELINVLNGLSTEAKSILVNDIGFNYNKPNYTSEVLKKLKNLEVDPKSFYYN